MLICKVQSWSVFRLYVKSNFILRFGDNIIRGVSLWLLSYSLNHFVSISLKPKFNDFAFNDKRTANGIAAEVFGKYISNHIAGPSVIFILFHCIFKEFRDPITEWVQRLDYFGPLFQIVTLRHSWRYDLWLTRHKGTTFQPNDKKCIPIQRLGYRLPA